MYYKNIPRLKESDVLVVTYPGSGTTWLANVLCELGLPYIDGYTEELPENDGSMPTVLPDKSRARTPSLDRKRKARFDLRCDLRLIKTHLWPVYFEQFPVRKIVLMVRDGRDAVVSYYHWRMSFSEEGENGSFHEFLRRPGINGVPPLQDWSQTILGWWSQEWVKQLHVLKFEDCKRCPGYEIEKLLRFLGVSKTKKQIVDAVEGSTFERMRTDEENVCSGDSGQVQGYIMRRGTSGGWVNEFTHEDQYLLNGLPARTLELMGYRL